MSCGTTVACVLVCVYADMTEPSHGLAEGEDQTATLTSVRLVVGSEKASAEPSRRGAREPPPPKRVEMA